MVEGAGILHIVVDDPAAAVRRIRSFFESEPSSGEVWVERREGRVCALLSGNRGWLMWLRSPDDPGLSSRNPSYSGPPDAVVEFILANGQVDRYPAAWTIPAPRVAAALEMYAQGGTMPEDVAWHDDATG